MNEKFTHDIPPEFTDDEKWLKYFSMKQLKIFISAGVFTVIMSKIFHLFGHMAIGIIIGIVLGAACMAIATIPVPAEKYITGGGLTLDVIFARKFIRKMTHCIYVLGYNDYADEEEEA